jgi:hypothetical protein
VQANTSAAISAVMVIFLVFSVVILLPLLLLLLFFVVSEQNLRKFDVAYHYTPYLHIQKYAIYLIYIYTVIAIQQKLFS